MKETSGLIDRDKETEKNVLKKYVKTFVEVEIKVIKET